MLCIFMFMNIMQNYSNIDWIEFFYFSNIDWIEKLMLLVAIHLTNNLYHNGNTFVPSFEKSKSCKLSMLACC